LGLKLLPRTSFTDLSRSAHCSSDLSCVMSGRLSSWQVPPVLQSPPLQKYTDCSG
jgi:hypothetical protein